MQHTWAPPRLPLLANLICKYRAANGDDLKLNIDERVRET